MQEKNKFTASILIHVIKEINGKEDRMGNHELIIKNHRQHWIQDTVRRQTTHETRKTSKTDHPKHRVETRYSRKKDK